MVTLYGTVRSMQRRHRRISHPEHQRYWFTAAAGCGLLGVAMIGAAATLASSTTHLDFTSTVVIVAYVAFCFAISCFLFGIRQWQFPIASSPANDGSVQSADPATSAYDTAKALTAALRLFYTRLDAHQEETRERLGFRNALLDLAEAVYVWTNYAERTDWVMQRWEQGELGDDDAQTAIKVTVTAGAQTISSDEVLALLRGTGFPRKRRESPGLPSLRSVLQVYGHEVLEVLERAFGQRRTLLEELVAELPNLRAEGPEAIGATTAKLHLAGKELSSALDTLNEYVRDQFPLNQ
jgi:hypothetical protein